MRRRIKEYQPWMLAALKSHMPEGWSYNSFGGRYNIALGSWINWGKTVPELREIREKEKAAHYAKRRFIVAPGQV